MEVDSLGHFSSASIHFIYMQFSAILNTTLYAICCSPSQKKAISCSQASLTATTSMNGALPYYVNWYSHWLRFILFHLFYLFIFSSILVVLLELLLVDQIFGIPKNAICFIDSWRWWWWRRRRRRRRRRSRRRRRWWWWCTTCSASLVTPKGLCMGSVSWWLDKKNWLQCKLRENEGSKSSITWLV